MAPAGYSLHVPKGTSNAILAELANVPPDRRITWRMHRVERGETLALIAKQFNTPPATIAQVNNNLSDAPETGDLLIIPASYNPDAPLLGRAVNRKKTAAHKTAAAKQVPDRILHRRAATRTLKTASARVAHNGE